LQGATAFSVTASLPKIVNLMPLRVKMTLAQQPTAENLPAPVK
jgi:hypothetical protein